MVEKIVWLRKHYHFGPAKIAMYLARYYDVTISVSGVWRILKRLQMNRLPASQRYQRHSIRWKRYEKQRPGHQLQVDVKFIEPLGQKGVRRIERSILSNNCQVLTLAQRVIGLQLARRLAKDGSVTRSTPKARRYAKVNEITEYEDSITG